MGQESANYFFRSKSINIDKLCAIGVEHTHDNKYTFKKSSEFWVDLEIQNFNDVSIRIALCNPQDSVLNALDNLLRELFKFPDSILIDLNEKKEYRKYSDNEKYEIEHSFIERRQKFLQRYPHTIAAVSADEFYRIVDRRQD